MYDPTNNQIYNYSNTTELSPIRIATTNASLVNNSNLHGIKSNYSIPVLSQQYSMQNSQESNNNNNLVNNLQHQVL